MVLYLNAPQPPPNPKNYKKALAIMAGVVIYNHYFTNLKKERYYEYKKSDFK